MITVLSASTYELDDPQKAIQEIFDQIDIQNSLLKNSVGLLFCHTKFIEAGIPETVCKNLPFDVLGCSSMFFAIPAHGDDIMLTLTVLTSDDIEFATGVSEPLTGTNIEDCVHSLYKKTASAIDGKPELIFAFPPTVFTVTVDVITAAIDHASGGIPVFGTVALDIRTHIRHPQTMYKGTPYNDRMALLLFKGPVTPRFSFIRFPEKSALAQDAVITSAEGPKIFTINNEPAASFLKEVGLIQYDKSDFSHAIPLVIEDADGNNPEVVVVQDISPEGSLICGRHVPVGGVINIGAITTDYVLESARTLFRNLKESGNGSFLFIVSCFLRSFALGEGSRAEVEILRQELEGYPGPWLYVNSGGELCPKHTSSGETVNQALQYALVACQL